MELILKNKLKSSQDRIIDPSLYEKIRKTRELIDRGETENLEEEGGIALNVFNYLEKKLEEDKKLKKYEIDYSIPKNQFTDRKEKKNALVLLIQFNDKQHETEPEYFKDFLFNESEKSLRNYYLQASYGKLDIDGDVSNWYAAKNDRKEYFDEERVNKHYPKAQELVKEAILNAKTDNKFKDFSKYSKDGKIEILIVIYARKGLDSKIKEDNPQMEHIWPHFDTLKEPIHLQDGVKVDRYCIIPEFPEDALGTFCHEVGHALGLPDLYYEPRGPIIGSWCLMAAGSCNNNSKTPALPGAWCRMYMGWTEPEVIDGEPEKYEIPPITESNKIYKLEVKGSDGKEYFLVENRQQKSYDKYLPASGLLIWHIDESFFNKYFPNSNPQHFFLTLEQSDGKRELEDDWTDFRKRYEVSGETDENKIAKKNIMGDDGDAYPGEIEMRNRAFDDKSNPNSNSYLGEPSGVIIKSISDSKEIMSAIMGIKPVLETKTNTKYYLEGYKNGYGDGYKEFMKQILHI
ncbi:M6 family metalloprotease domain-containing protein [Methanobacterium oryzae]|uniref:M6 family metalloprotease domain-containing protein n=1 Tax=Methanobacterium oryzae TaxID=69540 RepID=UPI003D21B201